ncbi:MAG: Gmad2 immunoglobulin-like domain-containing protein [Acidimicrobiia bacterium]
MKKSDDQRMKDLTNRMVAMSPEPPPFPEEVTMTTPARKTTMKPLTVFAAAAVVVLLGFGIPFLLMNGGEPPVAGPDTTTTTSTPVETTTTSGLSTTTTEAILVPGAGVGVPVFLFQSSENSFLDNPALVPFYLPVELAGDADDTDAVRAAMNALGDADLVLPAGAMNAVPAGVEALVVRRADGTDNALIIEMNEAFLDGAGGLLADFTMLNQLIYTATTLEGIEEVHFIVNNEPIVAFGSEGLGLESSVNRETFQEGNLALIYLTEPVVADGDGTMQIVGISNTFEATVNLIVRNGAGEVVHETFTNATNGSGTWGEFEFTIDEALVDADSVIQVFEYSAEDGDPANVIKVPVTVIESS